MDRRLLISSPRAKIARADEHLKSLNGEMDRWGELNPMSLGRTSNRDGSQHMFRLRLHPKPDLWQWGQLLGAAVHNLRCALDHTVYALAIAATGDDPPQDDDVLEFPICDNGRLFAKRQWRIKSLTPTMQTAIEGFQPYNRRHKRTGFAALEWLRILDDIDKHRTLQLALPEPSVEAGEIDAPPGTFKVELIKGPMVDGAPMVRVTLQEPDPNMYMNLKLTAGICIKAEDGRPIGITPLTRHIRKEVVLICRTLSELIPI
jgi:hypothetical protein